MSYQPGTHIIASLSTEKIKLLERYEYFKAAIDELIVKYQLTNLGEVYHNFSPAGFTGVICLSESHISVHTWPEFGKANLDIYLSNFERTNDKTVTAMYEAMIAYFEGIVIKVKRFTDKYLSQKCYNAPLVLLCCYLQRIKPM